MNSIQNLNNYCLDYKDFSANYKLIRKAKDPQLGETQLMKHKPTGKIVQVKEQSVDNEQDLNELLASLEEFLPYNSCQNFLSFLGFSIRQILLPFKLIKTSNSSVKWSIYMIYEYLDDDLEKELLSRLKTGSFFTESMLLKILDGLINCLEFLQRKKKRYGDIRPCNIYYSKNEDFIKLLYTNYAKTAFDLIQAKKIPYYKCFLAPEQLEIVGDTRPNEKDFDLIKCEIFSTAILILTLSCYQNKDKIYDLQEPVLLYSGINKKLVWFKSHYSNVFASLLEQMLSVNENLRPNITELRQCINKNLKCKLLLSESTIPKHHTTSNSFDSNMILNINDKNFDSLSLQRILNDSKSTKRTDKTTISIGSKEILENSVQNVNEKEPIDKDSIGIKEKDLKNISESEKKVPLFEKIKKNELKNTEKSGNAKVANHKRNSSEVPMHKKTYQAIRLLNGSLENSIEDNDRVYNLIKKLEKKILYEKNNPTILKPLMEKIHYNDGSIYIGIVNNKIREGKGIYYFSHQEVYGGNWKNDKFEGHGIYIYDNGDIYEGNFKKGLKDSKGIYYYSNGNRYDGDWLGDVKNGFGIFYFNNLEKFEGSWVNNEKNGPGVYYFSSGDRFEGIWINGKTAGKGTVHFSDKSLFEGIWQDNMPHGRGGLCYANGDNYEGAFIGGMKEGEGVYQHEAGSKYEGTWRNDEQTGKGILYYSNGDKYQGGMMNGLRFGYGVYWYGSGEKYEGEWKDNYRHGNGKLILGKDSYYEGEWYKGKRDGYGTMIYENKEKYEGKWKEDKKDGKGVYTWKNGNIYDGNWKDDMMNGEGKYMDEFGMDIIGLWLNNEFWEKC